MWARATAGTTLTVSLKDAAGDLAGARRVSVRGGWAKYTATFTATRTSHRGRLAVASTGAVALDMVSLFPRDTYKNQPNGLRKDLAEKIEALRPGFLRFPGGCLVNTGSMQDYSEASGWQRKRAYQWKDTVGPVEQRATNANFWGYNQSYGLGYYEYFRFAEDIGAMPLPVVPALVTGCGQNRATDDEALLRRHIQDTLDLIEFANGPATSTWGKVRAQMGHPKPFGLTHIGVGNEENLPDEFFARFQKFRAAIEAKYPDITVVSNSGPDDTGTTFDRLWQLNREAGVDMVDEHYYNSPQWFLQNNDRYDSYDRNGPKVFRGVLRHGHHASRDAGFAAGVAAVETEAETDGAARVQDGRAAQKGPLPCVRPQEPGGPGHRKTVVGGRQRHGVGVELDLGGRGGDLLAAARPEGAVAAVGGLGALPGRAQQFGEVGTVQGLAQLRPGDAPGRRLLRGLPARAGQATGCRPRPGTRTTSAARSTARCRAPLPEPGPWRPVPTRSVPVRARSRSARAPSCPPPASSPDTCPGTLTG
ncbi:hypothetical protein SGLAM104S_03112 [Streptomyces glaucescens]